VRHATPIVHLAVKRERVRRRIVVLAVALLVVRLITER
jgi:hypothetical protein